MKKLTKMQKLMLRRLRARIALYPDGFKDLGISTRTASMELLWLSNPIAFGGLVEVVGERRVGDGELRYRLTDKGRELA